MLTIKNIVKNQDGDILSELELFKRDFEEIILECPIPEDEDVILTRVITLKDDGTEDIETEKEIINRALNFSRIYKKGCEILWLITN